MKSIFLCVLSKQGICAVSFKVELLQEIFQCRVAIKFILHCKDFYVENYEGVKVGVLSH